MDLQILLNDLALFLVSLGVPSEHGSMAALGVIYVGLTLLVLLLVLLLLRRRSSWEMDVAPEEEGDEPPVRPVDDLTDIGKADDSEDAAGPLDEDDAAVPEPESFPEAPAPATEPVEPEPLQEPASLAGRLRQGLSKTRHSLLDRVDSLLSLHAKLDDDFIEELEEILITADFGMQATQELVDALQKRVREAGSDGQAGLRAILSEEIRNRLQAPPLDFTPPTEGPLVIMMVGVNGVGKTTTIGKLAKQFSDAGKKVVLGAGDTFRAAAAEQLQVWGERSGADVVRHDEGSDPGAVAFDAAKAAVAREADILLLDTAGRLHTKVNLMEELKKVRRVLSREIPGAPHETLLVLDATTGQNALVQAKMFQEAVDVSGLILTKLDGTAKGGIVVAINTQFDLPVRFIGIGEGVEDLRRFDADEFVGALFPED